MRTVRELESIFRDLKIDFTALEFYNQPAFIQAERGNPRLLAAYDEYVEVREYDGDYLTRSRNIVPKVAAYLRRELARDGRLSACHDASFALMKILEQLGIWSHISAGSLTIEFEAHTKLATRHWAQISENKDGVGHAWVVAPPFRVIDLTICQQANSDSIRQHLPYYVLSEKVGPVRGVALEDILDRDLEEAMRRSRCPIPTIHQLMDVRKDIAENLTTFRPFCVEHPPARLKYFPCESSALMKSFEAAKARCFSGRTIPEVYRDLLAEIGADIDMQSS